MAEEIKTDPYFSISPYFAGISKENQTTRRGFFEKFSRMPDLLRSILIATETVDYLLDLGQQYNLPPDQLEMVSAAIRYLAAGNIAIRDVPSFWVSQAGIDQTRATQLLNQIWNELLVAVADDIQRMQPAPQAPSAAPAVPSQDISQHNIIDLRTRK